MYHDLQEILYGEEDGRYDAEHLPIGLSHIKSQSQSHQTEMSINIYEGLRDFDK